ncbi:efflux RND transporter periplasmic adaptor subunit [Abyssibius alkaniclasticus]|uniref:efflux RND transporter periplasmic adaptor subunit n=1 Tax=Abyssibius alkaniclasticus TaxID=2881234 RepID=UPI002364360C|nr:efflux RND transporter periplasmic adaptor subunit [Abyssibius alkaniclasticus]UPH71933.1 efflux RND transporter periplasmic adaptor subunit [Abyssibius alkaniclasticus]
MRALKSYGIAVLLILILGGWLLTGTLVRGGLGPEMGDVTVVSALEGEDGGLLTAAVSASGVGLEPHPLEGADDPALSIAERNALTSNVDGPARSVRTRIYTQSLMPLRVQLRGHTEANGIVDAAVRTSDIVREVHVSAGDQVSEGDLICSLDSGTRKARVNQAQAAVAQAEAGLQQARNDFNINAALRERGLVSENSAEAQSAALRSAEANLEAAQVALSNAEVELENTEVRATVSGIIQRPIAKQGDLLNMGQSCAKIIQLNPMLFVGSVPQAHIDLARTGLSAEIRTINDQRATGEVRYVSASADPLTRTFEIEIEFGNPDSAIRDGLTAEATVELGSVPAHLVPQSILTLSSEGVLGIRGVVDGKVVFYPTQILQDGRDGAWVAGLPVSVELITVGQEYVIEGQAVTASIDSN